MLRHQLEAQINTLILLHLRTIYQSLDYFDPLKVLRFPNSWRKQGARMTWFYHFGHCAQHSVLQYSLPCHCKSFSSQRFFTEIFSWFTTFYQISSDSNSTRVSIAMTVTYLNFPDSWRKQGARVAWVYHFGHFAAIFIGIAQALAFKDSSPKYLTTFIKYLQSAESALDSNYGLHFMTGFGL